MDLSHVNWDNDDMVTEFGHFIAEAIKLTRVWVYASKGTRGAVQVEFTTDRKFVTLKREGEDGGQICQIKRLSQ